MLIHQLVLIHQTQQGPATKSVTIAVVLQPDISQSHATGVIVRSSQQWSQQTSSEKQAIEQGVGAWVCGVLYFCVTSRFRQRVHVEQEQN